MPAPRDPGMGEPGSDDMRCVVTGIGQWIDDVWVYKWGNTECDKTNFYLCEKNSGVPVCAEPEPISHRV